MTKNRKKYLTNYNLLYCGHVTTV